MNTITAYETQAVDRLVPVADTYTAKRPGRKTSRVLAAMLKRGSIVQGTAVRTEYKRVVIDSDRVLRRIIAQGAEVTRLLGRGGETVLIGRKQLVQLVGEVEPMLMSINVEYASRDSILGMTVKVIPWMDGVLVLPGGVA